MLLLLLLSKLCVEAHTLLMLPQATQPFLHSFLTLRNG